MSFTTPILYIVFNRPNQTRQTFNILKSIQPKFLYVAADGPRSSKKGEDEICNEVRNIVKQVDWDCEVKYLFRDSNLGCKKAVVGAIDWLFENEEQGIILEDDCLPNQDFFSFCSQMLVRYKDHSNIMHISGVNFLTNELSEKNKSYYYSILPNIWGWATWKRAWNQYDRNLVKFNGFTFLMTSSTYFPTFKERWLWLIRLLNLKFEFLDTWDYQWHFTISNSVGICISPYKNLVKNIGFDESATHTLSAGTVEENLQLEDLGPIHYNDKVKINERAVKWIQQNIYNVKILDLVKSTAKLYLHLFRFKIFSGRTSI